MEDYLASFGPKPATIAVLNYVGSLCPITLGHVQCLVQAHLILSGQAPPLIGTGSCAGCIALIRCNGDSHVRNKLRANGEQSLPLADRLKLCRFATAEHPWIASENVDLREWLSRLKKKFPHLTFQPWCLNGADDVVKYRKWTNASASERFLTMGRAGFTQKVLDAVQQAGTPHEFFLVAPELPDDISSTEARALLAQGDPSSRLSTLLHPSVIGWLQARGPWRPPAAPAASEALAGVAGTAHAVVQRPESSRTTTTMLRKVATNERSESVFVDSRTVVANGERVAVVQPDGGEGFTLVEAADGVRGFVQTRYLR